MSYEVKLTTKIVIRHPKNRMLVTPDRISLWYLKRDNEQALFRAPSNTKTHRVTCTVNGYKAKLVSVSTDGTARFERI